MDLSRQILHTYGKMFFLILESFFELTTFFCKNFGDMHGGGDIYADKHAF